jgi:hypothetical protein
MRSRVALLVVCVASLAAVLAGCGGASENGVAEKSPEAIVAAATKAIRGVKSVHVAGTITSEGMRTSLDLSLVAGKGGSGEVSLGGLRFRLIVLGQVAYLNGSEAFWSRAGGGEAAGQLLGGKWLKTSTAGQFESLTQLADLETLFDKLLSSHGTLTKGLTSTVAGQRVVAVKDTAKQATLYVATTGKPYPVEVSRTGPEAGRVRFDRYNEPVTLSAPARSVDLSKLTGG